MNGCEAVLPAISAEQLFGLLVADASLPREIMVSKSRWGNKNWRMTSRGLDMLSVLRCYLRLGLWHVAAVEVAIQLGQEFCFQVDRRPDTTCLGLGERETLTVTSHNPVQVC